MSFLLFLPKRNPSWPAIGPILCVRLHFVSWVVVNVNPPQLHLLNNAARGDWGSDVACVCAVQPDAAPELRLRKQKYCRACFDSTVLEELCVSHGEVIDSLTGCIMDYINFCVNNTVPTRTVQCFSNSNSWINPDIKTLLKGILRCKFNPWPNTPWNCVRLPLER